MADLPIEPSEFPGTPGYVELQNQRKRKRELALLYQIEEEQERRYCRHA